VDAALILGEGLKAQYVVREGVPSLHLVFEGDYVGYVELTPSELPYEITSQVRGLWDGLRGKVFWVASISSDQLTLVVAEEADVVELRDRKPGLGADEVKAHDPDFITVGLSIWDEEITIPLGEHVFIPRAELTLVSYSERGELEVKHVKKPPC
jgi:hypothetical protein